ncbi:unnamed protein product [Meloidogyne enterolobii]|uniref:Uncharacterized protein n=1 Tax=Meloidogyne enterolobii TaxID=390850 RepID=A0ACB1AVI6_MELEN
MTFFSTNVFLILLSHLFDLPLSLNFLNLSYIDSLFSPDLLPSFNYHKYLSC